MPGTLHLVILDISYMYKYSNSEMTGIGKYLITIENCGTKAQVSSKHE